MNQLFEEYNTYKELISMKEKLNKELLKLSGTRDETSIKQINTIAKELSQVNEKIAQYNIDSLTKISSYFSCKDSFDKVCKDIKAIEELSKESTKEKEIIPSAEGRNKKIDKELSEEYKSLVEYKKKLQSNFSKYYNDIKNITTVVNNTQTKEKISPVQAQVEYVLPKIKGYEDLTIDEKIKETKDRLERIFATSLLPNQGKKIIVTYNGDKKTIPRKYQGYFNETMKELRLLERNKTNNLTSPSQTNEQQLAAKPVIQHTVDQQVLSSSVTSSPQPAAKPIIQYTVNPKTLSSGITSSPQPLTGAVGNENIYQDIFNYKKYTPKEFASSEDQKLFEELFKKCPEEKKEEIYDKLFSKEAIARRNQLVNSLTKQIELEPTFRQTVTIAKSYITTVSKKLVDKVKSIGLNIKNKSEKIKEQASDIKYEVINRTIRFKENTCQKVNETKNKICDISKENARNLQFAFAEIKEEMQKRQEKRKYTKDDLFEIIAKLQEENRLKEREINLYKAKIKVLKQNSRGGYVATSIITIIGILILSGTIFTIIGRLLNH